MSRRRPEHRLRDILEAAARVFIEQGYRRSQMADVAASMGMAKGTLYLYVESKEALFDAALRWLDATPEELPATFPLRTPAPGATLDFVRAELARRAALPALVAALEAPPVHGVRAELTTILGELFDVLAHSRKGLKLLDTSARDYPELAGLWFAGARGGLLGGLEVYLADRAARGLIVLSGEVSVVARLVVESLVFWAVHRHWDITPPGQSLPAVDDAAPKSTVIDFLLRALIAELASPTEAKGRQPSSARRRRTTATDRA